MMEYRWETGICCTLCNPINLADLETCGVRVRGPGGVDVSVCEGCLALLDSMAFVDNHRVPSDPLVMKALGQREPLYKPRLQLRNHASLVKSAIHNSLEHRAGLRVAILALADDWRADAAELRDRGESDEADVLEVRVTELEARVGRGPRTKSGVPESFAESTREIKKCVGTTD
jgi:hypothetical protein